MKILIINGQNHHGSTYHIGKVLADSLFNWEIPKIYKYGMAVAATGWEEVSEKKLAKIHKDMEYWKQNGWTEGNRPWKN